MNVRIEDLPPWAQKQIANKMALQKRSGTQQGAAKAQRPAPEAKAETGEPASYKWVIYGDPRTKKNHQMIAGKGAKCPTCGKPEKQFIRQGSSYGEWSKTVRGQLIPKPKTPIEREVSICYTFYMKTHRRVDGLNLQAAMDDILVEAGVLADDNTNIVRDHDGSRVLYDAENPRVEVMIQEV